MNITQNTIGGHKKSDAGPRDTCDGNINAKNEGAGETEGGCGTPRRDDARQEQGRKKRVDGSVNICGATPLVSQNHVLTTMAI